MVCGEAYFACAGPTKTRQNRTGQHFHQGLPCPHPYTVASRRPTGPQNALNVMSPPESAPQAQRSIAIVRMWEPSGALPILWPIGTGRGLHTPRMVAGAAEAYELLGIQMAAAAETRVRGNSVHTLTSRLCSPLFRQSLHKLKGGDRNRTRVGKRRAPDPLANRHRPRPPHPTPRRLVLWLEAPKGGATGADDMADSIVALLHKQCLSNLPRNAQPTMVRRPGVRGRYRSNP